MVGYLKPEMVKNYHKDTNTIWINNNFNGWIYLCPDPKILNFV